jgi:hypothetical protein
MRRADARSSPRSDLRSMRAVKAATVKALMTLAIGDRVKLRGLRAGSCGTITQVLDDGVVRVLWDNEDWDALQFGSALAKVRQRRAPRLIVGV